MHRTHVQIIGILILAILLGWAAGNLNGNGDPLAQPQNKLLHRGFLVLASHQAGEMGITVWCDREFGNQLYMNVAGSSNSFHSNLRVVQGGCSHDKYVLGRSPYSR